MFTHRSLVGPFCVAGAFEDLEAGVFTRDEGDVLESDPFVVTFVGPDAEF